MANTTPPLKEEQKKETSKQKRNAETLYESYQIVFLDNCGTSCTGSALPAYSIRNANLVLIRAGAREARAPTRICTNIVLQFAYGGRTKAV